MPREDMGFVQERWKPGMFAEFAQEAQRSDGGTCSVKETPSCTQGVGTF